ALGAAVFAWALAPARVPRAPRLTTSSVLTRHEMAFPPFGSEIPILVAGPRLYFPEFRGGRLLVREIATAGRESGVGPPALGERHVLGALSPDGATLLVASIPRDDRYISEWPLWSLPAVGGTAARLGTVRAHDATWLPDGRILLAVGDDLVFVRTDQAAQ